ncbi:MAG TPA: RNA polymerase sigma factor [Sandaracinaceae bacterium LLY-WYZ-13_1]|nr:RNA polymerase sigma factor [Sandaracinaceae bacterium LLY-WYZ-13_1]
MDPDAELIARAREGDPTAFRQIFVRHRDTVSRIVYRMIGPSPDVEDVVQDVFLNVYRSLPSFRGDSKFSTWLYRLATNVTRMHLRRGRSRPRFSDVEVPEAPRDAEPQAMPDQQVEQAERVRALYRLLDELSDKKREVLVLHDLEGVPAKEIAATLEIPVLTVRTRLFYGRKELYARLAEEPSLEPVMEQLMDDLPGKPKRDRAPKAATKKKTKRSRKRSGEGAAP